jgi:transcriptional regulator GlxA family with amidase domain
MIEQGRHSIDVIAQETGFGDRYRMRRAFLRVVGRPPQAVRSSARGEARINTSAEPTVLE